MLGSDLTDLNANAAPWGASDVSTGLPSSNQAAGLTGWGDSNGILDLGLNFDFLAEFLAQSVPPDAHFLVTLRGTC